MIKTALFDLDGVVFNTEPQYTVFWGNVMKTYYPEEPGLELKIKGQTLVQIYDKYFPDADVQAKITKGLDEYERNMTYEYVTGFEAFIKDLKAHGMNTAVVTSSNRDKMENVYHQHPEFKEYFDRILTSEDFDKSKPDPDCYLKGAACFDCTPAECVGFEDSFNGLKAVKAAKEFVVGLSTTNSEEQIAPYSNVVISDYVGMDYAKLLETIARFQ